MLFKTIRATEIALAVFFCNQFARDLYSFPSRDAGSAEMAKQESLRTSECPVARTLESIGERWCLMIIREAFDDVRRLVNFKKIWGWQKTSSPLASNC